MALSYILIRNHEREKENVGLSGDSGINPHQFQLTLRLDFIFPLLNNVTSHGDATVTLNNITRTGIAVDRINVTSGVHLYINFALFTLYNPHTRLFFSDLTLDNSIPVTIISGHVTARFRFLVRIGINVRKI